ncbi:hypothetical protein FQN54_009429 [Arachnomyces sp. PD_36]|nr:hypothetical protein FQN54_009429 [Arachnomyces sp. PD_36]
MITYEAASRRLDRSLEKRYQSALRASDTHEELYGLRLIVTREIVENGDHYMPDLEHRWGGERTQSAQPSEGTASTGSSTQSASNSSPETSIMSSSPAAQTEALPSSHFLPPLPPLPERHSTIWDYPIATPSLNGVQDLPPLTESEFNALFEDVMRAETCAPEAGFSYISSSFVPF